MEQTRGYRDLVAWQKGIQLTAPVYGLARMLPQEERFELSGQIRKAVVSVPANIAEGQARRGPGEFLYHLGVARGSLAEVDTLLEVGVIVGYFERDQIDPVVEQIVEERRILQGLIAGVERWAGIPCPEISYEQWLARQASGESTLRRNPPA